MKAAKRVDRDFFDRWRSTRPGFRRVMMSDIKRKTRCANCGDRGHWAETCKNPFGSKADRMAAEKTRKNDAPK
eukprot:1599222-Pyramimonas_sp.AAC.1